MSLALNVFNEKTTAVLNQKKLDDTALFISKITGMWYILNVKSPNEGVHLNDPDRHPISSPDDERLLFLENMATSLKLMDSSKRERVRGLSSQTANAWHVSLLGTTLLALGMKYVSFGKVQSDGLEGKYGAIRQLSCNRIQKLQLKN